MRQPPEGHPFVAVVVRVDEQYDIGFPYLFIQICPLLRQRRCIHDGGCHILRRTDARRDGDLREDGLDLVGHKDVFHKTSYQT